MTYVFYSFYIDTLLKGKLKAVQIVLSGIITVLAISANAGGGINYMLGRSSSGIDLLFMVLFVYSLMNLVYSIFSSQDPSTGKVAGIQEKVKSDPSVTKNETGAAKVSKLILQNKSYGSGIKTSPKVTEVRKETVMKNVILQSRKTIKEEISAPPLEINTESTEELVQDAEGPSEKYSGIINDYTPDVIDFSETPPPPGTKSAF